MRQKIPPAIKGQRIWLLVRLVLNGFAQVAVAVANARLIKLAFDRLIKTNHSAFNTMAWQIGLGLALAAVLIAALRVLERTDAERIGQHYADKVRMTLYDRLTTLSPRALQSRSQGGVMLRFVGDLQRFSNE
jgi:ABC-type multidrug transport system fused ATPase/permease subunit